MRPFTVHDLVSAVRSQLNEDNRYAVSTASDVLPALNRAQSFVAEIYGRSYQDALLVPYEVPFISGQGDYELPEGIFGDRVVRVEIVIPFAGSVPVPRVSAYEQHKFEAGINIATPTPSAYMIHKRNIRFLPKPTAAYSFRIWATQAPEPMVLDWGRIATIDSVNNYIVVDALGGSDEAAGVPTTSMDDLSCYINLVDAQTGIIKGTMQAKTIVDNKITFKSDLGTGRTTVWNDPIITEIPTTLELDDYICSVAGTCIPTLDGVAINFMIQYAVSELRRKLGDDSAVLEKQILDDFEKQVKSTWAGRDQATRITKKSRFLASPRYFRR